MGSIFSGETDSAMGDWRKGKNTQSSDLLESPLSILFDSYSIDESYNAIAPAKMYKLKFIVKAKNITSNLATVFVAGLNGTPDTTKRLTITRNGNTTIEIPFILEIDKLINGTLIATIGCDGLSSNASFKLMNEISDESLPSAKHDCFLDADKLSSKDLVKLGISSVNATKFIDAINSTFENYDISTCKRRLHFLAQVRHESTDFKNMIEIWGPTSSQLKYEGNKMLGNTQKGDGKRFLGRGLIQITGRNNYTGYGAYRDDNFVTEPNNVKLAKLPYCVDSSGWYWSVFLGIDLNDYADKDDLIYITYRINGGFNGFADRKEKLIKMIKAINGNETLFVNYEKYLIKNSKCWKLHDAVYKYAKLGNSESAECYKRYVELTENYLSFKSVKGWEKSKTKRLAKENIEKRRANANTKII